MQEVTQEKERILKGIGILRNSEAVLEKDDAKKMQAVMYAFANKFLTRMELEDVKEAIVMTILGQMIYADGVEDIDVITEIVNNLSES